MRDLFLLAGEVQSFCRERGWKFCFIGGLALQRWGEPRLTGDVDLTILTGFGDEAAYIDALCGRYEGRIPDTAEFARRNRVLLLQSERGHPDRCIPRSAALRGTGRGTRFLVPLSG